MFFGNSRVAALRDRLMAIAKAFEVGVSAPVIREYFCPRNDGACREFAQRQSAAIRYDRQSHTPGVPTAFPVIQRAARLAPTNFNRRCHHDFVARPAPLPSNSTADIGLIEFDMAGATATDTFLVWPNHAGP